MLSFGLVCFKVLFYVSFVLFIACEEAKVHLQQKEIYKAVFAFGDSIVDQGNNKYITTKVKCEHPPYGKDFIGGTPTGRFSNGKTPPDFLVEGLGIKELMPAYLEPNLKVEDLKTGVSFASGGCGYDPLTSMDVSVISLLGQLTYFQEYIWKLKALVGEEEANNILKDSLFIVVAGTDDLANTYFSDGIRRKEYDVNSYSDLIVAGATRFLQELYKLGARKIWVFGIPPIGCVPSQRTKGGGRARKCVDEYNQAAQLTNIKFTAAINSLSKDMSQSKLVFIDMYYAILDLIVNPQKYGFEEVEKGCCGTGMIEVSILCNKNTTICEDNTKYLFWDSYHPTEKGYKILLDQIINKYIN